MIRLEDAGLHLSAMIVGLEPGGEVTIVAGGEPIAHLQRAARTSSTCQSGTAEASQHGMARKFHAFVPGRRPQPAERPAVCLRITGPRNPGEAGSEFSPASKTGSTCCVIWSAGMASKHP